MKRLIFFILLILCAICSQAQPGTQLAEISKIYTKKEVILIDGLIYKYSLPNDTAIYYNPGSDVYDVTVTFTRKTTGTTPTIHREAENFNAINLASVELGTAICCIKPNAWILYVTDFSSQQKIIMNVSRGDPGSSTVFFRTGSQTGPIIASVVIANTGSWQTYKDTLPVIIPPQVGTKNVYLTFSGACNINWIKYLP